MAAVAAPRVPDSIKALAHLKRGIVYRNQQKLPCVSAWALILSALHLYACSGP
jgi:hypothetical protein